MSQTNKKELRQALGQYMTGVTIVTTIGDDAEPRGVTANSFSSVSLEPPLILWSLAKKASSGLAFRNSEYFCVHVLTASQQALAERFACTGVDKFDGLEWSRGLGSVPLLSEFVVQFQCRTVNQHSVGDHIVFFGEVLEFENTGKRPLVFHGGQFALAERRNTANATDDDSHEQFSRDRRVSASTKKK